MAIGDQVITQEAAPPRMTTGAAGWARANLFSDWRNSITSVVVALSAGYLAWLFVTWSLFTADWSVVPTLGSTFIIGQYNTASACSTENCFWRPQVSLLMLTALLGMGWAFARAGLPRTVALVVAVGLAATALLPIDMEKMGMDVRLLMIANIPAVGVGWAVGRYTRFGTPKWIIIFTIVAFFVTLVLLRGVPGVPGLEPVSTRYWGGLMLNLLLATIGITASLPIGIGLALGRRSKLPVVKVVCVGFIEMFRGVPLITLLFMSQTILPLALPADFPLDLVTRAAIVITLFSAAYMAENIRGGLQSLSPGQAEAASALGLPIWQTTIYITLPQAIRNVIPAIVGQFIGLFKDTSLVYVIGLLDIVEIGRAFIGGNRDFLDNSRELFIFVALVFWVFNYAMSYVSKRVEERLGVGQR